MVNALKEVERQKLISQGNAIVRSVEEFRSKAGRLPKSLEEIGYQEDPLYYVARSTTDYIVVFVEGFDDTVQYVSSDNRWQPVGVDHFDWVRLFDFGSAVRDIEMSFIWR